jgi:threonyl-tRNA synthetase
LVEIFQQAVEEYRVFKEFFKNLKIFDENEDFGKIFRLFFLKCWKIFEEYEEFSKILEFLRIFEDFCKI